jgi:uncharacterized protein (TIGR00730 family)
MDMRICVYSGSNLGFHPRYLAAARQLGKGLARRGMHLIYGGASVGLMGAVADAALDEGGKVTGVIPQALVRAEIAHTGLDDLRVVASMHERKALMAELADGFIALPGGLGTLEEMFEAWTWAQLGHHAKPCALYNVDGYFDRLVSFLDTVAMEGFLAPPHRDMLIVADGIEAIVEGFRNHAPPAIGKWLSRQPRTTVAA